MNLLILKLNPWLYMSRANNANNVDNGGYSSVDDNNNNNHSMTTNNDDDKYDYGRWGFVIFLLLFLSVVIFLCAYIPEKLDVDPMPEFHLNSLEVTSLKVYSDNNVSNENYYSILGNKKQHLMADLDLNLTLKNKAEEVMYFNPMQVSLEYHHHDEFLSSTVLEPFLLLEDQHQLQFGMQIKDDDTRLERKTVDSISPDLWGQDDRSVLQFALKGECQWVRWHRGGLQKCGINFWCDDIQVGFGAANNLTTAGSMIVSPLLCKSKSDCHHVV